MKKIKILYCIDYLSTSGTEKQLISLINGLKRENFEPHLCCLRSSEIGEIRKIDALQIFKEMEYFLPIWAQEFISLNVCRFIKS